MSGVRPWIGEVTPMLRTTKVSASGTGEVSGLQGSPGLMAGAGETGQSESAAGRSGKSDASESECTSPLPVGSDCGQRALARRPPLARQPCRRSSLPHRPPDRNSLMAVFDGGLMAVDRSGVKAIRRWPVFSNSETSPFAERARGPRGRARCLPAGAPGRNGEAGETRPAGSREGDAACLRRSSAAVGGEPGGRA